MLFYNFVSSTVSVRYIDSAAYYKRINDKVVNLFSLNDLLLKTKKQQNKKKNKNKKKHSFTIILKSAIIFYGLTID